MLKTATRKLIPSLSLSFLIYIVLIVIGVALILSGVYKMKKYDAFVGVAPHRYQANKTKSPLK
ncbi:hypothetical protein KOY_04046 [Bacillus cereus VDM021]|nr:hypothetical protein KOY_04046 [Bacillus cereus VDM021]